MLREIICGQITLESKGLSVDQAAIKMEALYLYIEEKRWNIVKKAIDLSTKKSATFQQKEEFVVKIEWPVNAMQDSHIDMNLKKLC